MLDLASNVIGSGVLGEGDFQQLTLKSYGLISGFLLYGKEQLGHSAK